MNTPTSSFPLIDNMAAPDLFADQVTSFHIHQGIVRVTFEKFRLNVTAGAAPASRLVVGQLFLPTEAAEVMAKGMLDFIARNRAPVAATLPELTAPPDATIN